jgi:hypothetical protein
MGMASNWFQRTDQNTRSMLTFLLQRSNRFAWPRSKNRGSSASELQLPEAVAAAFLPGISNARAKGMLSRLKQFVTESNYEYHGSSHGPVIILPPDKIYSFDQIRLRKKDKTFWGGLKIRLRIWRMLWRWEPGTACTIEADPYFVHFCTHVDLDRRT